MQKKITVAGHVCLDLTPAFLGEKSQDIGEILQPGSLIRVGELAVTLGGAVFNTGAAFQKLGNDVQVMAKVGSDAFGELAIAEIKKTIPKAFITQDKKDATSYSVVLAPPGIDRIFLHHPGANTTFSLEDINLAIVAESDLFHLGYPPLLDLLIKNDGIALKELLAAVKELGIPTAVDMVAIDPQSAVAQLNWEAIIQNFLPYTDFFLPSAEELAFMIDRPLYETWKKKAQGRDIIDVIDIDYDLKRLSDHLLRLGGQKILIKCGHKGLYLREGQTEYFQEAFVPREVVSATGAGDVAIAGFLTSYLKGETWEKALEIACAMGSACVEQVDFNHSFPGLAFLQKRIDSGWATHKLDLKVWQVKAAGLWIRESL